MTENKRWKRRPAGSTWGDFGDDDQLGRLNLITPEKVLQGIAEVREGMSFCLSLPLDYPGGNKLNPRRHPPELRPTLRGGRPNFNYPVSRDDAEIHRCRVRRSGAADAAIFDAMGHARPCRADVRRRRRRRARDGVLQRLSRRRATSSARWTGRPARRPGRACRRPARSASRTWRRRRSRAAL